MAAQALPEEFDWRNVDGKDYVSPVRNQGWCGSCYAFGTLAMFEARVRILTNGTKTPVFSTQDIVSCSEYSQGCEGGMTVTFEDRPFIFSYHIVFEVYEYGQKVGAGRGLMTVLCTRGQFFNL